VQIDGEPAFAKMQRNGDFEEMGIKIFNIPPRSGDMAPMETFWADAARDINRYVHDFRVFS